MSSRKIREVAQNICANLHKFKTQSGRDVEYVSQEIHQAVSGFDRWINVKDRLPEDAGLYFCFAKVGPKRDAILSGIFSFSNHFGFTFRDNKAVTVTHWMPLPELPKDKK